ncbi:hypothetical protein Cgig2_000654 [Carnegiea gigantea]|uniref:Reverse transcriptase zinc-binding domain-containing protein n=1 Tax=Carnegiea gigantea TaxID=171969 RepID=A0A9Q1GN59_9CARY|nr:hypothetical protein Cgig2_000654 [Carnegiea gigantea]
MDFTQTHYLPSSLSDHTPLLIQFSSSPRPLVRFQFYDMWIKHKDFSHLLACIPSLHATLPKMQHLKIYLNKLRPMLMKLNRHHFADLRAQPDAARLELTTLQSKLAEDSIFHSYSSKIKYGDDNTRLFHARARQRKLSSYIYSLADDGGNYVEGFDQVKHIMIAFYKNLLGKAADSRKNVDLQVIHHGPTLSPEDQMGLCKAFTNKDIKDALHSIPSFKSPGPDGYSSGFFKAIWEKTSIMIKEDMKRTSSPQRLLEWRMGKPYKVAQGYKWQLQLQDKAPWAGFIWSRANIPSYAFISWVFIQGRLPTKVRLAKFHPQQAVGCLLCSAAEEDNVHLIFTCTFASKAWEALRDWWKGIPLGINRTQMLRMIKHTKEPKLRKQITGAIMVAAIYNIWRARNHAMFKNHIMPVAQIIKGIKE